MDKSEFQKQQYITLRSEIHAAKARTLWILMFGILLVVFAAYLSAIESKIFANAAIPLVLLVLILAYIVEQNTVIRAGRYIREHIEPGVHDVTGWEHWLSDNTAFREVDRFLFGGFIITFLAFYVISCNVSLDLFNDLNYGWVAKCAGVTFGCSLLFVLTVLIRHWRSLSPK